MKALSKQIAEVGSAPKKSDPLRAPPLRKNPEPLRAPPLRRPIGAAPPHLRSGNFFYKPIFVDYNSTNWTRKMYDHSNRYKISRGIE